MKCRTCGKALEPNGRYCPYCGAEVPRAVEGAQLRGVAIEAPGGVVNIGSTLGAPPGSGVPGDHCPICGAYNPPGGTFRCKECGRSFICRKHQDDKTWLCSDCRARLYEPAPSHLFQINYQFVYPYLPADDEALVQALISFTSREDIDTSTLASIPTHLCLVLDVSGSMNVPEKYPLLRQAIPCLMDALSDDDYLTIVLFSKGYDVALTSEPLAAFPRSSSGRRQKTDLLLARIDRSGVAFGRRTELASALRAALDEVEHFRSREPSAVDRIYILTDGQLHDADSCCMINNPRLRSLEAELHSYGFGRDFALDTIKHVMEGVPGGTVKPILNTQDVAATFSHIGDLAESIVAQDAEFAFTFAGDVTPGDAFRYKPGTHYYRAVDPRTRTFTAKLGALEKDRTYSFLLEGRVHPSSQSQQQVGKAMLRYRQGGRREQVESPILVSRTSDSWRYQRSVEEVKEVLAVLEPLRIHDPAVELTALRARLAICGRERADPLLVALLKCTIGKLEAGQALTADERRQLRADGRTDFVPIPGPEQRLRRRAEDWLQRGHEAKLVTWLLRQADAIERDGVDSVLEAQGSEERHVLSEILSGRDPFEEATPAHVLAFAARIH